MMTAQSKGMIIINKAICIGCRTCEIICSLVHEGSVNPDVARLRVIRHSLQGSEYDVFTCHHCEEPSCISVCPVNAIIIDEAKENAVILDEESCIGCKLCIDECSYTPSRIIFDEYNNVAKKCDLCNGNPECVEYCPVGALSYNNDEKNIAVTLDSEGYL